MGWRSRTNGSAHNLPLVLVQARARMAASGEGSVKGRQTSSRSWPGRAGMRPVADVPPKFTLSDDADSLAAVIDSLALSPAHVVGLFPGWNRGLGT